MAVGNTLEGVGVRIAVDVATAEKLKLFECQIETDNTTLILMKKI